MLLLNINRKPYMRSPMPLSNLTLSDLERSKSRSVRYINTFASSSITTLIWMSQKAVCWRAGGIFRCPSCLSCLISYCQYFLRNAFLKTNETHVTTIVLLCSLQAELINYSRCQLYKYILCMLRYFYILS